MKKMTETPLKLNRETLRALEPASDREGGFAIVTSTCKSGWTCCNN
jgi:hypothetical protein